ncbi:MAG: bifunctional diaminohydroxyphosphoribosylaminopyrimidine deaminase/5-amino-6-(5-phosphoribosylamino)uracil reductase RibD [Vicinamibacterales bacterium]
MCRALQIAARGRGQTTPNPMVGAIVADGDGAIVATGYHARAGDAHAEIVALMGAGARARGATLYCTLEPCCHHGRTGPCVEAIVQAGIVRVVAPTEDPNPLVSGGGVRYLRAHGVRVDLGVCEAEARRLNEAFFTSVVRGRPFVIAKVATSLDGRIASAPGHRTRLSSAPVNRLMQRQRAEVDAVGVGVGTVLADDPALTVREVFRRRPLVRVVFDSGLRTPTDARVLDAGDRGPCLIVSTEEAVRARPGVADALTRRGATIVTPPTRDIASALGALQRFDVQTLLLEGGAALHRSAFMAGVVDKVQMVVCDRILGPDAVPWVDVETFATTDLIDRTTQVWGPDLVIEGYVHRTH